MAAGRRPRLGLWELAYVAVTALALSTVALATVRIRSLESSATWLDERVRSQVDDYEATLRSRFVDQEMQSFKERRQLMEAATGWWQLRLAALMLWVLCSFAFYIHRTIAGFAEEITDLPRPPTTQAPIPSSAPLR